MGGVDAAARCGGMGAWYSQETPPVEGVWGSLLLGACGGMGAWYSVHKTWVVVRHVVR